MREYVPGDDLRRIVWRASARTGKIMVREAEQGITDHITIILDTDRGAHSRDGEYSESFETGVRAAASLGVRHLREGYEVRIETNGGPLTRPLRGTPGSCPCSTPSPASTWRASRSPTVIMRLVSATRAATRTTSSSRRASATTRRRSSSCCSTGRVDPRRRPAVGRGAPTTLGAAAALGCQVAACIPARTSPRALYHDIGAGSRC